jgi:hypothetical protein
MVNGNDIRRNGDIDGDFNSIFVNNKIVVLIDMETIPTLSGGQKS